MLEFECPILWFITKYMLNRLSHTSFLAIAKCYDMLNYGEHNLIPFNVSIVTCYMLRHVAQSSAVP